VTIGHNVATYGAECITLGDDVVIAPHVILRALTGYPWSDPPQTFAPDVVLGNRVFMNSFSEISAANKVVLGDDVLVGNGCYITDNAHGYQDVGRSLREQPVRITGEIIIHERSWLSANVVVVGDVRIGKHCVIGANAVVNRDIPDYSLAVGVPARVVRRYDPVDRIWRAV
jgi:acetyltransferase-like isoleucine patch superfamily enzyme